MLYYLVVAVTFLLLERIYRMASTDPLAGLNAILTQLQIDLAALQASSAAVLAYLKQLVAGQAAGTVSVDATELATAVTNATAIDTALQALNTTEVAAEPAPAPAPA